MPLISCQHNTSNNYRSNISILALQYKHLHLLDQLCHEQVVLIDLLVQRSVKMIDSLWKPNHHKKMIPTYTYIYELLRRSKVTFSVFQLALYYIFHHRITIQHHTKTDKNPYIHCGRRMFLAALITASKYLNDKTYKNKVWAEMANLNVKEVNQIEASFLELVNYELYVSGAVYGKWIQLLYGRLSSSSSHHHQRIKRARDTPLDETVQPKRLRPTPDPL
ncbi:cyclin-domain-containing protein [Sporodiniella umbellata]|nr:cyclin-domain-containing protein [Sporodiniella umbellata]